MSLIGLFIGIFQYSALVSYRDGYGSAEQVELTNIITIFISIPQSIVQIVTAIVFLYWFRRAYWNLHQLPNSNPESVDSMAVWGFIIPIISLFKPPQIMKEIWQKSQRYIIVRRPEYSINRNTSLIGIWWALFIITNIIGRFAVKSAFKEEETINSLISSSALYMVTDFLDIPGAIITWFLIDRVRKVEADLHQVVHEENAAEPKPAFS